MAKKDKPGRPPKVKAKENHIVRGENILSAVLFIIICILIASSTIGMLMSGEIKTFASFLDMLQAVPTVDISWIDQVQIVVELPEWLTWLNPFIDLINGILYISNFATAGILQALGFILYFIRWFF